MSLRTIKTKYDSVNQAMGIGRATKPTRLDTTPLHETKVDKALRTTREALDRAEEAVHGANAKSLKAAKRGMEVAQAAYTKAYTAHEKGTR